MEELEKTYLLKFVPLGLENATTNEVLDIYLPSTAAHAVLRIRKSGAKYEMTKKVPVVEGDASRQLETTIPLTEEEYTELATLPGKRIRKIRYYFEQNGNNFEVDVFKDTLEGLVLVDIEFTTIAEKGAFGMPDFCLVDITQEKFIAGGMLCGKSYSDITENLDRFKYTPALIQ